MKKIFTLLFGVALAVAGYGADAANDLVFSQREADNSGFIQRNVTAVANSPIGFNTSSVPVVLTAFTHNLTTGAVGVTAGGADQNVTITPSDSGTQGPVAIRASYSSQTIIGTGGLQIIKQGVTGGVFPSLEVIGYRNGFTAQSFLVMASANGTEASPTTNPVSTTVGGFRFYARANSAWRNIGNVSTETSATFSDSDFSSVMRMGPSTSAGQSTHISMFGRTGNTNIGPGATTEIGPVLGVGGSGGALSRTSSWGLVGSMFGVQATTVTDTVSTGTVATAVANSFAVPTFAASSATTFTNAANFYIAGDVAAGTNTTLTNSYGLWNVGKTRLDGAVTLNGKVTTYNSLATAGNGVVSVQGAGRLVNKIAAEASVATYTVGASDASFAVSANVLVVTSTTHNFTVTCSYTDEGNTARTLTLPFSGLSGTIGTSIANAGGAVPYEGVPLHIRAKAATAITVATTGTFTSVTYNVEGVITKLQ